MSPPVALAHDHSANFQHIRPDVNADPEKQVAFNRDQWVQSFEGRMQILRPHMADRVLATLSNSAWYSRGAKGEDPITQQSEI